jgi:hypothetical protein
MNKRPEREQKQNKTVDNRESPANNTSNYKDKDLEPQVNYSENLINQLKPINIKQPINIEGEKQYKSSEELKKQWDRAPHLTVVMDNNITENYVRSY